MNADSDDLEQKQKKDPTPKKKFFVKEEVIIIALNRFERLHGQFFLHILDLKKWSGCHTSIPKQPDRSQRLRAA